MNPPKTVPQPLEGFRVLDMTEVWAGPMCTSVLGDLGAAVIKVESFPRPSLSRLKGRAVGYANGGPEAPRPWDRAALHNMANRNKYGVTLNIRKPQGMELFWQLVGISDVVAETFTAGTAARMGVDYAAMSKVKPDIVMLSMSGWGTQGPYQGYAALGSALDGFSGHHGMRGYPGTDASTNPVVQHSDTVGAVTGAFAILTALHHRQRTGQGQWIDMSQVEGFLPHLGGAFMDYVMNGRSPEPMGNRHAVFAPYGCYRCRGEDDWVVIHVTTEGEWTAFCRATGHAEWAQDPRFGDGLSRHRHQDELDPLIEGWTRERGKMEVMSLLQEAGVSAQAVLDDEGLYADPHLRERGFFEKLRHPVAGEHRYPGKLWKLSKTDEPIKLPPNTLGQHNDYIYGELLGLSDAEIERLRAEGIIGEVFPPEVYDAY